MTKTPNGAPSGLKVDAAPLCISGNANVDMQNRVVSFPVRRRLDLSAQMVVLPSHVIKELAAMIIHAECQHERAALAAHVRPAIAKPDVAEPAS